jgi:hypothetical protein
MSSNQTDDGEWHCVTYRKKNHRRCQKCEITATTTKQYLNEIFKPVSTCKDNIILKCILDDINKYYYNGGSFIILPECNKYEINIFKIYKNCVLLTQSHLHTDLKLRKSFKNHAYRYVKITW